MELALNSKQRAYLRSLCNTLQPVLYIGKDGITDNTVTEAWNVLEARELIKCSVQREAPLTAREACAALCEKTHAAPVQCIGSKFCIYRPRRKDPTIILP
ncbi:MAG: YhbY family RNA-binding protein [Clostridia bacterium]|nr:YhbY family RNA-binding protein [Clostridia bacterium]